MRFSTALFTVVALVVGVAQALPTSNGANSLNARPSAYKRDLDVAVESDEYMSKRDEYSSSLERKANPDDECMICLEKIRAPKGLGSFCSRPDHEQCRQCIETLIRQQGAKCPMCRGVLDEGNFTYRVCKAPTPPPSPGPSTSNKNGSKSRSPSPNGKGKV